MIIVAIKEDLANASLAVCITNCVQCKQMFGPYFQGRACGDACLASNGRVTPDCNNPGTLGSFLKRLY
ncbi:eclosion hormone-like [Anoplophora glabripennis]|uniref:eclosion hormone-like n=1 Tax=Anoplophora glabripennis TaxID=217634 RepID=UPI00087465DD|nr:eclosion hormone-like [Anoplophora glabripennis]